MTKTKIGQMTYKAKLIYLLYVKKRKRNGRHS
jgi:hypothetical protein